ELSGCGKTTMGMSVSVALADEVLSSPSPRPHVVGGAGDGATAGWLAGDGVAAGWLAGDEAAAGSLADDEELEMGAAALLPQAPSATNRAAPAITGLILTEKLPFCPVCGLSAGASSAGPHRCRCPNPMSQRSRVWAG